MLCVLTLHRLRGQERGEALLEINRVLKPGGHLLAVDFGGPSSGVRGWLVRKLAAHDKGVADHLEVGLGELLSLGGLNEAYLSVIARAQGLGVP